MSDIRARGPRSASAASPSMTTTPATLLWFRSDLRLDDHPALHAAVAGGGPIVPVFLWCPAEQGLGAPGSAGKWWLHRSLIALQTDLEQAGSGLVVRSGSRAPDLLTDLVRETGATRVVWTRSYEPEERERDAEVERVLAGRGVQIETHGGSVLFEPWDVATQTGRPFQVFTPFWKACLAKGSIPAPRPRPASWESPARWPTSEPIASLGLEPTRDWARGFEAVWQPGERGAQAALERFVAGPLAEYDVLRDRPDVVGTSRLSPHLHFGEIGPRRIWEAISRLPESPARERYRAELGWREFARQVLFHQPRTATEPLRPEFARFPWDEDAVSGKVRAWQRGRTGYPIVDAGMRELWATGWMHNRVRMIVASFLTKDLHVSWRVGAEWFRDTLVDADLANNVLGWQWTAGCGADAAPFFRIFHPVRQGEKFDPDGTYVRRWVPELRAVPPKWIHAPWTAPPEVLAESGVQLDRTYPRPIVDHATERTRALEAFAAVR